MSSMVAVFPAARRLSMASTSAVSPTRDGSRNTSTRYTAEERSARPLIAAAPTARRASQNAPSSSEKSIAESAASHAARADEPETVAVIFDTSASCARAFKSISARADVEDP